MYRLILVTESRIRRNVYVRFGGEYLETYCSNTTTRRILSLPPDSGKSHLIERMESRNATHILDYAEELGLGTQNYEVVNIEPVVPDAAF